MTGDLAIMKAINAKMKYLSHRQSLLSQNIANADTPRYEPKDLTEVDFSRGLKKIIEPPRNSVHLASTAHGHIPSPDGLQTPDADEQDETYDVTISGNSVVLEEQMVKAGRTRMDFMLMTSLYRKQGSMIRTALGRSGG